MTIKLPNTLGKNYLEHWVFGQLTEYADFFRSLSDTTMGFVSSGSYSVTNINTYVFTSIQGTLESIHDILYKGRINDSYPLLRKYYDSAIINIYTNLYVFTRQLWLRQLHCRENWQLGKRERKDSKF